MAALKPDMAFIRALNGAVDRSLKKCMQCGTCSATCALSPTDTPFPRKEMARAGLGMKAALIGSLDIWLCYHCNDCTRRCPRGARPGDVLAAIRKESILHFATPRFMAAAVSRPLFLPLLFLVPALLLCGAVVFQTEIFAALHIDTAIGEKIVYSHSPFMPHRLLILFFGIVSALSLSAMIAGLVRFRRAVKAQLSESQALSPRRSLPKSLGAALKEILRHDRFTLCEASATRRIAHICLLFGFLALVAVTSWVIAVSVNPLVRGPFVYPFAFLSPFKILANVGGAALLLGCGLMLWERLKPDSEVGKGTYFDRLFLMTLALIVLTGFATEVLHYLRIVPHRHVIYFVHLVSAATFLLTLPFTKLAHMVYRAAALGIAARIGREAPHGSAASFERGAYRDRA